MRQLEIPTGWAVTHEQKERVIQEHFKEMMKRPPPRTTDLNWDALGVTRHHLNDLDALFIEDD